MGERLSPGRDGASPTQLDGLSFGIEPLGAIFVFQPSTGRLRAQWVRAGAGFDVPMAAAGLWSAYRACREALLHLEVRAILSERNPNPASFITLEMGDQSVLMTHTGGYVLACAFEGSIPLGMARFVTSRIAASLEPRWRTHAEPLEPASPPEPVADMPATLEAPLNNAHTEPAPPRPKTPIPAVQINDEAIEPPPRTLDFPSKGSALVTGGAAPQPPGLAVRPDLIETSPRMGAHPTVRASANEVERVQRVLAHLEKHAPEPHVARLRVALRAGLVPLALSHPETLGPNALVLIETAVEDILGVDLSDSEVGL